MSLAISKVPVPVNEPVKSYAPGSPERASLQARLKELSASKIDMPLVIAGKDVRTGRLGQATMPHRHKHVLGDFHQGGATEVRSAIDAALRAQKDWAALPWEARASVFLKAADLLAGPYRDTLNAATMLGQSKTCHQAEIDSACELIDFFRFNVAFYEQLLREQPQSSPGMWNRLEHRPLEGFVFAVSPFNFTSIAGNLPTAPALCGNTVVWKPASTAVYSAHFLMQLFREAGLPDGVINLVSGSGGDVGDPVLNDPHLAGIHFTGSTKVFHQMWRTVGGNIDKYRGYPRLVGETGGKDFVIAHASADPVALATALIRGAFEYQGQKCSAASRAYIPSNLWPTVRDALAAQVEGIRMGDVADFSNFMGAVIDGASFRTQKAAIDEAKSASDAEILVGGTCDDREGWFVRPTVIVTKNPAYRTLCEELFGPVLTVHVYDEAKWLETLDLVDSTSPYALTGAVFAQDRYAIEQGLQRLRNAAGNFYINDKPTGAVVGQQPFGGARASGTNDKAGSILNLLRWISPRSIKETFVPATDYRYPFMG
ncbi:L-glutamate gamma-semialdehyde dehydrogenase [Pseudoluteimonas lycopersici]|uniref:L-glutamate gamma-semialdehyde dehydrogenase n=1 Tax=Pseudoluteimonas lycopersici TaxID=1324796 RepID=A0A516V2K3_9GAMM|nr:L-glutamate gamma-semialdehyde dehydrogenase [Lysobacter lycopersici]QDQ72750.1 L-glutamate gamma-semialdehyde dehydrogenase [Lysobacter lycopersici]